MSIDQNDHTAYNRSENKYWVLADPIAQLADHG